MPYPSPNTDQGGPTPIPPLPDGYEWRIGAQGGLELWKSNVAPNVLITSANIGEFDVKGSLRTAINTIYLERAHSIKSGGEEMVVQNLESKVFYTPVWGFTSENGESVGAASVPVEAPTSTDYLQNGSTVAAGTSVQCVDTHTTVENGSVYEFSATSAETYSGKLYLELRNPLGDTVFRLDKTVALTAGASIVFDKLLYRVRTGNVRTLLMLKADGTPLLVRGGADPAKPWVKVVYRGFTDRAIVHVDAAGKVPTDQLPQIDTVDRKTVANLSARLGLPVSSKFRIIIQSDSQRQFYLDPNADPSIEGNWVDGGSVASEVTSFNGRTGNVTPQPGDYTADQVGALALPATDGVRRVLVGQTPTEETIVDDLTSTSRTNPLSAAQGKVLGESKQDAITGAASTITTENLTANRVLVSDGEGKVAASGSIDTTALGHLAGVSSNIQEQLNALNTRSVSSGYFQQETVTSDVWTSICEVGGLSIEARNPGFTTSFPIRIVNQTGDSITHITDKLYDGGTRADGLFVSPNGASLGISPPALTTDAQDRLIGSAFTGGNGFGLSEKAWSYNVVVRRVGTAGYRIVASMTGN